METTFSACRNSYEWIAQLWRLYPRLEKACCINAGCRLQRAEMVIDGQCLQSYNAKAMHSCYHWETCTFITI